MEEGQRAGGKEGGREGAWSERKEGQRGREMKEGGRAEHGVSEGGKGRIEGGKGRIEEGKGREGGWYRERERGIKEKGE